MKKIMKITSSDGKTTLNVVAWRPNGKVKAVLQIAHGVTEYIERYEEFAQFMNERGIYVVGNDHIGHGHSIAYGEEPMYFSDWNYTVKDLYSVYGFAKDEYPEVPYFLMGFSMGSFMVRQFLIDYPGRVDATIIMGTGQQSWINVALGKMMANSEAKKVGEEHGSPVVDKLTFGTYNKFFKPNRTEMDWLCACETALDKYIADPMRGKHMSAGLFREMLNGMLYTAKKRNISKMDKDIPVLFLSGDKDPVGDQGKGVKKAYNAFKKSGIKDVTLKLYPGLRHDILHEEIHKEIYEDIYNWISKKTEQ